MNYNHTNLPIETTDYGESVIPASRVLFLYEKCKEILRKRPGNVLEIGVYRGGTLKVLAKAIKEICPKFSVYGIDTFNGHPYSDGHVVHYKGKYQDVDRILLENYLTNQGLGDNVILYTGLVEDIFENIPISDISFAHIDCDLYKPIKFCAGKIPPLINKGGMIYFDDYLHEHCPGATRAILEEFPKAKINTVRVQTDKTEWSGYIYL